MKQKDIPCYGGVNDRFDYDRMRKHRDMKPKPIYFILAICALLPFALFLTLILK